MTPSSRDNFPADGGRRAFPVYVSTKGVLDAASMGLTPSGGVIVTTRTGDIDPGVLIYLLREKGLTVDELAAVIDHASGMTGVSGVSGEMQRLRATVAIDADADADADLTIRMFERSVCKQIATMGASMGGIDMLVLTGGIGQNDTVTGPAIREGVAWLPSLRIRTMPSQEDEQIALHTGRLYPDR
jgi:acetate kinase